MGDPVTVAGIQRIVLALDATLCEACDVDLAFDLAQSLGAALEALIVEDADLAAAARLPLAREVARAGAIVRQLETVSLDAALRRRVERATRTLAHAGGQRSVPVSVRTERGKVVRQALAESAGERLVLLPGGHERPPARVRGGSQHTARARPVLVWCESADRAGPELALAASLARQSASDLRVAFAGGGVATEIAWTQALETGGVGPGAVHVHVLATADLDRLIGLARASRAATLVLGVPGAFGAEAALDALLAHTSAAIVLVRR